MSVFVVKYMSIVEGVEGKDMKKLLGGLVAPRFISRYVRNPMTGIFEVQTREYPETLNRLVLDPYTSRRERLQAEREGFTVETLTKYKDRLKKQGFRLVSTDENGSYSKFSRPWNKEVLDDMFEEPVNFNDDGKTLWWSGNYRCNEKIDGAVSRHFPNVTFEVSEVVEFDEVAHYEIRNGKIVKDYLKEEEACC